MTTPEAKDLLARVGVTVGIPAVLVALGVLLGFCSGCTVGWPATCTDLCLVEASVARGHGHEVRIVAGRTDGELHATGQAWEGGEWRDLRYWGRYWGGDVSISYGAREVDEVVGVYEVEEWAAKRRRWGADLGECEWTK